MISVDLEKAKEITKQKLRKKRAPLLAEQDILFQRALESSSDTSAIVAEKQRLRDLPASANSKTTATQLKNLINAL